MRLIKHILETIQSVADVLLRNGARINLPPPPQSRLDREPPPGCCYFKESSENHTSPSASLIERTGLKIDGDDIVITLFGGKERIQSSQRIFSSISKLTNSAIAEGINVQSDLSAVPDSVEPGGSDSKSCAICWSEFGLISNRKQFCHVSTRYVCNDCSTKRLVEGGRDVRISDGQFLLAKAQEAKTKANLKVSEHVSTRKKEPARESKNRLSLGLKMFSQSNSPTYTEAKSELSTKGGISSAVSGLGQARDAVVERGSKLQGLAEKTDALSQASLDFANMAKELNRQQNSFW